ncbi:MAG: hypothetical protein H6525_00755 [Actinobacteria bacterium]|nr:hypothetical protein [Actinomycetota bacterium]
MASGGQEWGEIVTKAMSWGRDRMEAARVDRVRRNDPVYLATQRRQAALAERERVAAAQTVADQRYANRRRRLSVRAATGNYVAAGAVGLGTLDLVTGIGQPMVNGVIPASPGLWFVSAAVAALIGIRARLQLRNTTPPPRLALPPVPPPVIPAGSVGAEEAADVYRAEAQLIAMIPVVDRLLPQAGLSLRDTLATVQPTMHALIERLELVSNIDAMRAPQAAEAAETLRRRLAHGVVAYDRLIAATATLLAAPDPAGAATESLAMASNELEAYAAGLVAASDAFDRHDPL